jgi:hypothetical protein
MATTLSDKFSNKRGPAKKKKKQAKESFFDEKAKQAETFLLKHGLPKSL